MGNCLRNPGRIGVSMTDGRMAAAAGLGLCVLLAVHAGGCGESHVVSVDKTNFRKLVLDSDKPVLMDFDKYGCAICIPTSIAMQQLSNEYYGRATVAHFTIMSFYWTFPAWEIKQKYNIYFVPTVILFNKGVEVKRWDGGTWTADLYRQELDRLLPANSAGPGVPGQ